jgi:hypothetical protein
MHHMRTLTLLGFIASLMSDGDNPEYDKACVEIAQTTISHVTHEDVATFLRILKMVS